MPSTAIMTTVTSEPEMKTMFLYHSWKITLSKTGSAKTNPNGNPRANWNHVLFSFKRFFSQYSKNSFSWSVIISKDSDMHLEPGAGYSFSVDTASNEAASTDLYIKVGFISVL